MNRLAHPSLESWSSKILLFVAGVAPRGGWHIVKWAAQRDPKMQCISTRITGVPGEVNLDLRDRSCIQRFLTGDSGGNKKVRLVLAGLLREGDTYIDVGANYGTVSMVAASCVGASGKVIAIEPGPTVSKLLTKTFANSANVTVCPMAISETEGLVEFFESDSSVLSGLSSQNGASAVNVQSKPLDAIVAEHGLPQVLKVDVEGSEERVFRSAGQLIKGDACPIILFEALSVDELEKSCRLIAELHGDQGEFLHVSDNGKLLELSGRKNSSDYVYVPHHFSDRVVGMVEQG